MSAITCADYMFPRLGKDFPKPELGHDLLGGAILKRLSPFHIPSGAQFSVDDNTKATIRFDYENEERPEREFRTISNNVRARLGEQSKKVLEIEILGDVIDHFKNRKLFSTAYTRRLAREVPPSAAYSMQMNAELIYSLLRDLPDEIIDSLTRER